MEPTYYSSPVAQKTNGLDKKILIIIIGVFLLGLGAIALLLLSGKSSTADLAARAVVRQQNLYEFTIAAQKNIGSADVRKINADAGLFLASDLDGLRGLMQDEGQENISEAIASGEVDTVSASTLADAKLNNRYDNAYIKLFMQKIDTQQALLQEISNKTNSTSTKQGTSKIYDNLEYVQKQLENLGS